MQRHEKINVNLQIIKITKHVSSFDFEDEFTAIGGEEFYDKGICIIEWGEKIRNLLPLQYLEIEILRLENESSSRHIIFRPIGERYEKIVKEVLAL